MKEERALSGVKVIELSTFVAVPACGRFLADLGAEVIKVESIKGDTLRFNGISEGRPDDQYENTSFDLENANKKGLVLDLKSEAGKNILFQLLDEADVFLTNWRTQALKRAGLDYETLKEKYPKLVYGCLTGYGEKGPDKDLPGYDFTAFFARSGILGSLYQKGTVPMNLIPGMGDHQAGLFLAAGVVAALYRAIRTGKGEKVSTSLMHSAIYTQGIMLQAAQYTDMGQTYPIDRMEADNPFNCSYETKDNRFIQLSMPPFDLFFPKFMPLIGREDLVGDSRFTMENMTKEKRNREFCEIMAAGIREKTAKEWTEILSANDIPFSIAQVWSEVLEDPQAWATDVFYHMEYPHDVKRILVRQPVMYAEQGLPDYNKAPLLGEHSREIITGLGYSETELAQLQENRVFATWDELSERKA